MAKRPKTTKRKRRQPSDHELQTIVARQDAQRALREKRLMLKATRALTRAIRRSDEELKTLANLLVIRQQRLEPMWTPDVAGAR